MKLGQTANWQENKDQKHQANAGYLKVSTVGQKFERLKARYSLLEDNYNKELELFQGQLCTARNNLATYKVSDTACIA
jgi:hypothetical protein